MVQETRDTPRRKRRRFRTEQDRCTRENRALPINREEELATIDVAALIAEDLTRGSVALHLEPYRVPYTPPVCGSRLIRYHRQGRRGPPADSLDNQQSNVVAWALAEPLPSRCRPYLDDLWPHFCTQFPLRPGSCCCWWPFAWPYSLSFFAPFASTLASTLASTHRR